MKWCYIGRGESSRPQSTGASNRMERKKCHSRKINGIAFYMKIRVRCELSRSDLWLLTASFSRGTGFLKNVFYLRFSRHTCTRKQLSGQVCVACASCKRN
jgi:hypothetical protein